MKFYHNISLIWNHHVINSFIRSWIIISPISILLLLLLFCLLEVWLVLINIYFFISIWNIVYKEVSFSKNSISLQIHIFKTILYLNLRLPHKAGHRRIPFNSLSRTKNQFADALATLASMISRRYWYPANRVDESDWNQCEEESCED